MTSRQRLRAARRQLAKAEQLDPTEQPDSYRDAAGKPVNRKQRRAAAAKRRKAKR